MVIDGRRSLPSRRAEARTHHWDCWPGASAAAVGAAPAPARTQAPPPRGRAGPADEQGSPSPARWRGRVHHLPQGAGARGFPPARG
eukprot:2486677-Pyramimonas_sp.AAC.1